MKDGFRDRLAAGKALLADGAIGSMLLGSGLPPGAAPESLNLSRPEILEEIARRYLDAGAEIVQTNTFGASPLKLSHYGLEERTAAINEAGVAAVRRAVGERAWVSASCGPSGRILKPFGDTDAERMSESFLEQMQAVIGAGADLV
jgi:5-methyltetrahydrofolate--homocysteine methyltransferase